MIVSRSPVATARRSLESSAEPKLRAPALPAPFAFRWSAFADRGAVIALVIVGIADAGNMLLYFLALDRGPIVVAVLSHYLAPTLVALAAPLVLAERVLPVSVLDR